MDRHVKKEMRRVIFDDIGLTGGLVVDVGSYDVNGSFRDLFDGNWKYVGIDRVEGPNVDVVIKEPRRWDCKHGPQEEEILFNADVVISSSCLQYTHNPFELVNKMVGNWAALNGHVILCAPRHEKDGLMGLPPDKCPGNNASFDCWRFLPDGMFSLMHYGGLHDIKTWYHHGNCWGKGRL